MKRISSVCICTLLLSPWMMQGPLLAASVDFNDEILVLASPIIPAAQPSFTAVGDINGDGKPDLVVSYSTSNSVGVLLGAGTGNFGAPVLYAIGAAATSVTVGDFNGDGKADLAALSTSAGSVIVLLGTGAGFGAPTSFAVGTSPFSMVKGDFNGDGNLDLATANVGSNNVSVLLGTGAGAFAAATNFAVGSGPYSITMADFNADGKLDLATANVTSNDVSVLLGTGAGSFGAAVHYTVPDAAYSVVAGDFNADGVPDLAVATPVINKVSVLLGTGAGGFGAATDFAAGVNPGFLVASDLNGDGALDVAGANFLGTSISVLHGTGMGTFSATENFPISFTPSSIAVADLNLDGTPDITSASSGSTTAYVSMLLNSTQSIAFAPLPDKTFGDAPFNLSATATPNFPVQFSVVSGPATIDGSTLTITGAGQVTVRASRPATGIYSAADDVEQSFNVSNSAPVISSQATALPSSVFVNEPVAFFVAASDNGSDSVSVSWNFGDASAAATGGFVTHAFSAPSTYTVTATATDSLGATTVSMVQVTVSAAGSAGGTDSDGDGFSDAIEIAAGTSASNASDTPTGGEPVTNPLPLPDVKLGIKLNFAKPASDAIGLSGTLLLPDGFSTSGAKLLVDIGGVAKSFTLSAKGSVKTGGDSAGVKSKGTSARTAKFAVKLGKGDFGATLSAAGLNNGDVTKDVSVPLTVVIAGNVFQKQQPQVYKAKAGKSGATKDKK